MSRIVTGSANGVMGTSVVNGVVSQQVPSINLSPTQFLVHEDNIWDGSAGEDPAVSSPRNPILGAKNLHGYSVLDGHHRAHVDQTLRGSSWVHQEADSHGKYIEPGAMSDDHTRSNVPSDQIMNQEYYGSIRRTNPHDMMVVNNDTTGEETESAPLYDESQHDTHPFWRS